ncbi:MAG: imelysin family protein [Bacteroidetes bacterium]|nr:imelysin family protein [Bacteroidota bacterium]
MRRKHLIIFPIVTLITASGIFYSCSKSGGGNNPGGGGGNTGKDTILTNIGNNIILPAYVNLSASVNSLDSAILDFNAGPTSAKLTATQNIFKTAYINWQYASAYNYFGPASSGSPLLSSVNLFPAGARTIDSNIFVASYNVNGFTNVAAKGFPAIDYLLFGAKTAALDSFTTSKYAANRKQYLATVSADIKTTANNALKGWQSSGGNYINTFINGTGNSISSSLGLLLNSFIQDFEILKNYKLGIPLAKQPPGTTLPILPDQVEAYYSGISSQLALNQLKAAQNLYLGIGTAGAGPGLKDYLIQKQTKYGNGLLSDTIRVNLATAVSGMQAIPDPFSQTIQTNAAPSIAVYTTTQKLVVLIKTDMTSALGVLVTFGDNDGD